LASTERRGAVRGAVHAWSEGGPLLLASRVARWGGFPRRAEALAAAGAARALRRNRPRSLHGAVSFAHDFDYGGVSIRPMQHPSEIRSFLELLEPDPPSVVLEIGTARGGTLFLFAQIAHDDALLVSIDVPGDGYAFGGRPEYKRRARLYRALGRERQRIVYVAGDSHREETYREVRDVLSGKPVDLLFIDGDHTRAGVERDFEMYLPLVRNGGIVAFHDIVPGPPEAVGDVPSFWRDIRTSESVEIVADWQQRSFGIGVLPVCGTFVCR
jgi:predicted O-methyltransferase YrrM